MKYLQEYKTYESRSYQKIAYIVEYLKDMCLELTDKRAMWHISPKNDIEAKVLGLKLFSGRDYPSLTGASFYILIDTRHILSRGNDATWFIDLLYQIESFMDSQEFKSNIGGHLITSTDYIWHHSVEEFEDNYEGYFFKDVKIEFVKK